MNQLARLHAEVVDVDFFLMHLFNPRFYSIVFLRNSIVFLRTGILVLVIAAYWVHLRRRKKNNGRKDMDAVPQSSNRSTLPSKDLGRAFRVPWRLRHMAGKKR